MGERRFGGSFRVDAPETFARLLETRFGLRVERRGQVSVATYPYNPLDAVGWHGEIWRWNGANTWRQIDSPLSSHLSAACCKPDGTVIAVGYDGAMVQGKGDEWQVIDTGRKENLLSVAHFRGETYACSAYSLMRLTPNGLVAVDNLVDPDDEPVTCLHLLPSDDGEALFSLGPKDLFLLTDSWKRIV